MPNTNVTIVGNLTRDPELRFTNTGLPVCNFSVAVNDSRGEDKQVSYYDVTAWRDLASNAANSLTRGCRVVVTGELKQRSWQADDGSKRSKIEIVAEAIGPDLRFAAAQVIEPAASQNTGTVGAGIGSSGRGGYGGGEEPF